MLTLFAAILLNSAAPPAVTAPERLTPPRQSLRVSQHQRRQTLLADGQSLLEKAKAMQQSYQPVEGGPSKAELDGQIAELQAELDSLAETDEMQSLRLQMAMDRMSKLMSTLSNLLKKISETQSSIVQNIK